MGPAFESFLDSLRTEEEEMTHYFAGVDLATLGRSMLPLFQQALGFDPGHFPLVSAAPTCTPNTETSTALLSFSKKLSRTTKWERRMLGNDGGLKREVGTN